MSLTKIIKINPLSPEDAQIRQAAQVINNGGLVIIPTETVYGIAVDALNNKAVNRLYEIKKRPRSKPFAMLIAEKNSVRGVASGIPLIAYKLMRKFWPGPLTILLKSKDQGKVGLRLPDNRIVLKIIAQAEVPLACPSANISDKPAPVNFEEAIKDLDGLVDLAIDAGPTQLGVGSTIVDLTVEPLQIVRSGAIKNEEIIAAIRSKKVLFVCTGNSCRSVMAEAYLKKLLREQGRSDVEVDSAGIIALEGIGASKETLEVLAREGMDAQAHRSQKVTRDLINESDIILVMEKIHEEKILQFVPEVKNRLFLLKEFAKIKNDNLNITDPIGRDLGFYQEVFSTIKDAVERMSKII